MVVSSANGNPVLRPFPSWEMNKKGDCDAIQYAHSMEIDPNTGYMWIIDIGRGDILSAFTEAENLCPAKIIILDLATKGIIRRYEFPDSVVSSQTNFLNNIVLDYVGGSARYAYMTDTREGKMYVYDYVENDNYYFTDITMKKDSDESTAPIGGIAISYDFRYVYYCTLSSRDLYAIPTSVLHDRSSNFTEHVIYVGRKASGADGMAHGERSLYYAGLSDNAIYRVKGQGWDGVVSMATEEMIMSGNESVQWADTFAFNGTDVWFIANKLTMFMDHVMDFSGNVDNMYIWKLGGGEHGYLWNAAARTKGGFSSVPGIFG